MIKGNTTLKEYDFSKKTEAGLLICAGGFEDRTIAFVKRLRKTRCHIENALVLQYESQREDNDPNFRIIKKRLKEITQERAIAVSVNANSPLQSYGRIKEKIWEITSTLQDRRVLIDISGMRQLWSLGTIHASVNCGLRTAVIYTEARWYFPLKGDAKILLPAWKNRKYEIAVKYLQSEALKAVHILPEFSGNFRPGKPTCLMLFTGYEPNRIQGLVDDYAPGALVVFYGKSPHPEFKWRLELSKKLHAELFSAWYHRGVETSTFYIEDIIQKLEEEFQVIREHYDVAITPHCAKMQGIASYLFWRRHPEVQLLFTSPVRFNPIRFSRGARGTFITQIN